MADTKTPLEEDRFYHIYNHAVGSENLFLTDSNYEYFLQLIKKHTAHVVEIFAYCLMPNHFHLIVKTISLKEIEAANNPTRVSNPRRVDTAQNIYSKCFSNLFNSYAQSLNKQQNRKGSLFNNRFKRIQITDDKYLRKLTHYIHYNPVGAGLCNKVDDWKFSSYNSIISNKETSIKRNEMLEIFSSIENFIYCHNIEPELSGIE